MRCRFLLAPSRGAASQRERKVELGRIDRAPKRACSYLDEAADVETSALDQLLSILDGRRDTSDARPCYDGYLDEGGWFRRNAFVAVAKTTGNRGVL